MGEWSSSQGETIFLLMTLKEPINNQIFGNEIIQTFSTAKWTFMISMKKDEINSKQMLLEIQSTPNMSESHKATEKWSLDKKDISQKVKSPPQLEGISIKLMTLLEQAVKRKIIWRECSFESKMTKVLVQFYLVIKIALILSITEESSFWTNLESTISLKTFLKQLQIAQCNPSTFKTYRMFSELLYEIKFKAIKFRFLPKISLQAKSKKDETHHDIDLWIIEPHQMLSKIMLLKAFIQVQFRMKISFSIKMNCQMRIPTAKSNSTFCLLLQLKNEWHSWLNLSLI